MSGYQKWATIQLNCMSIQRPSSNLMNGYGKQETKGSYAERTERKVDNGGTVATGKWDWLVELLIVLAILVVVVLLGEVEW